MSAIVLLSVVVPGKTIITSRIPYYPQVIFNGYYSLRLPFSMLFLNSRQNQYCIWNGSHLSINRPQVLRSATTSTKFLVQPIVPTHCTNQPSIALRFTTICSHVRRYPLYFQLPQRDLCPFLRSTSWLVTYVIESTNYSARTRDVALDQQTMFPSVCGIHLNFPELLLALINFEPYSFHAFEFLTDSFTRIHNVLALQIKSLSVHLSHVTLLDLLLALLNHCPFQTLVACIPYPSDAALYSHCLTPYDFQRHLSRCSQPLSSSLSLSAAPLCLPLNILGPVTLDAYDHSNP